ncbi:MAG: sensor histidine kinase [Bacteroidales bacterium]|nr:sensor histidine kinase [Bacteroidales bacterium]
MYSKNNLLPILISIFKSLLIVVIGTSVFAFIFQLFLEPLEIEYFVLLAIIETLVVFAAVSLIITEIFHFNFYTKENSRKIYTSKSMMMLFSKCSLIVIGGLFLAIIYSQSKNQQNSISFIDFIFYLTDLLLTFSALIGIVKGEKLRNESVRRIQSENNLLKSQLNPHFLYNTLNNIDALIWISPEKASDSILKLSYMMRYMTYKTKLSFVSLNDEVNYISEYIELQRMRYNNPGVIEFKLNVADKTRQIAPMLLIAFIENAFKHSTESAKDGAIVVEINSDSKKLSLYVENCADNDVIQKRKDNMIKEKTFPESGRGLILVKKRLDLIYKNRYSLRIDNSNGMFKVNVEIKFQ